MSDTIRAGKIIASALLISAGAVSLTIASAVKNANDGIQFGLVVMIGVGVCLLVPAWLGTPGHARAANADDVDTQVRREVEKMRSIARTAGRTHSESAGE